MRPIDCEWVSWIGFGEPNTPLDEIIVFSLGSDSTSTHMNEKIRHCLLASVKISGIRFGIWLCGEIFREGIIQLHSKYHVESVLSRLRAHSCDSFRDLLY